MATNYQKAVDAALLNTWRRGVGVSGLLTDKGAVAKKGDSVEIPTKTAATVNTSESMSVETASYSADTLTVDTFRGTNTGITVSQHAMMLQGDGNVVGEVVRESNAALINSIDAYLIKSLDDLAGGTPAAHQNFAGAAVTSTMLGNLEASMREQDGIGGGNGAIPGMFYLASPRATAAIKAVSDFVPAQFEYQNGVLGLKVPAMVNGIPYFEHAAVPGGVDSLRKSSAATASAIATNVWSLTVGTTEAARWSVGEYIWTSGGTADIPVTAPVAITGISAGVLTCTSTASNDAANGALTVYSGTASAMLCYAPWLFYSDTGMPYDALGKREANAGWYFQLAKYIGFKGHAGAVKVLHTADGF